MVHSFDLFGDDEDVEISPELLAKIKSALSKSVQPIIDLRSPQ